MCGMTGGRKLFDMDSRKPLNKDLEDDNEPIDEDSSIVTEEDSDSSSSDDEDVNVAFLFVDRDFEETHMVATIVSGPYEIIEGLVEPKMELAKKQELMVHMLSLDLSTMGSLKMLFEFLELLSHCMKKLEGSREKTCALS